MRELDPGVLAEGLERLGLDQRDVAAAEVAVTGQALGRSRRCCRRARGAARARGRFGSPQPVQPWRPEYPASRHAHPRRGGRALSAGPSPRALRGDARDGGARRARLGADRPLGDRPPARGALPGARPGGARGGHGDRLLDAAHGGAARARARGHAGARPRARRPGALVPGARRGGRPRRDRRGRRARDAAGTRRPVRPAVRGRQQGRVRPLHRAGGVEALGARADGGGQPADERRGGAARGRRDPLELRTRSRPRAASTASCSRSERWLACVLPVGDGIGVAARR